MGENAKKAHAVAQKAARNSLSVTQPGLWQSRPKRTIVSAMLYLAPLSTIVIKYKFLLEWSSCLLTWSFFPFDPLVLVPFHSLVTSPNRTVTHSLKAQTLAPSFSIFRTFTHWESFTRTNCILPPSYQAQPYSCSAAAAAAAAATAALCFPPASCRWRA